MCDLKKGKLFIVSGPSGSGKDTLINQFLASADNAALSISSITRPMRPGEKDGEKYHFISTEEFRRLIEDDMLLEYNVYLGNYYGTPKKPVFDMLDSGTDVILEIDVNGAKTIREKCPECVSIFIMPPSFKVLKKRLSGRGTDAPEKIKMRLSEALNEIKRADEYDYIVVNGDLGAAVADLSAIIRSQKSKLKYNINLINEVLSNVES